MSNKFNQTSAADVSDNTQATVRFLSAVGGTVGVALNTVIVADLQQQGAYTPGGGVAVRSSAGGTPNYTAAATSNGDSTDFEANWVRPVNAVIAAQRLNRVGVIVRNRSTIGAATVANGEQCDVIIAGRVLVQVSGFSDDATTGATANVGGLLTLDGNNSARLGGLRVAASGERAVGRIVATAAGVPTGTAVASTATGTATVELFGDTIFRA
jgi:hypothetical protein